MTKKHWSKFFWSDWDSDEGLRQCSLAAQGLWMRMLCICAKGEPVGYLTIRGEPLDVTGIARAVGIPETEATPLLKEMDRWGVFSRDTKGRIYSRRIVRDEEKYNVARKHGEKGGNPSLKPTLNPPDKPSLASSLLDSSLQEKEKETLSRFRRDVTALYAKHFPSELPPDTNLCDVWEAQGLDAKLCLAAIAENFERSKKFKPLQYFSRMLAELHEKKVDVPNVDDEAVRRAHWSMLESERRIGRWPSNRTPKSDISPALIAEFESQHPIS